MKRQTTLVLLLLLLVAAVAADQQREMWGDNILSGTDDTVANNHEKDFCEEMYMSMYMDGLHWSLLKPGGGCLNYFVNSWKLENASAFRGACLYSFLLALLVEGLSGARLRIIQTSSTSSSHTLLTIIYGVQGLLGYLLMIIAMSFSLELILSVVVGLMCGHFLFVMRIQDEDARISNDPVSQETTRPLLNASSLRRRNQ